MDKSDRTKRVAFNISHDANKAMHRLATYLDRNPANLMRDLLGGHLAQCVARGLTRRGRQHQAR